MEAAAGHFVQPRAVVGRDLDGFAFEVVVLRVAADGAEADVAYLDDGNIEHGVPFDELVQVGEGCIAAGPFPGTVEFEAFWTDALERLAADDVAEPLEPITPSAASRTTEVGRLVTDEGAVIINVDALPAPLAPEAAAAQVVQLDVQQEQQQQELLEQEQQAEKPLVAPEQAAIDPLEQLLSQQQQQQQQQAPEEATATPQREEEEELHREEPQQQQQQQQQQQHVRPAGVGLRGIRTLRMRRRQQSVTHFHPLTEVVAA